MATSSTTPTFSGSSTYAADLQSAITRAVGFATLPVTLLQNKQNEITNQQSALSSLLGKFQSLGTALSTVEKASTIGSLVASSTDNTIAAASVTTGAKAGKYTVNVVSTGSQTSAISSAGGTTVTDPTSGDIGSGSGFSLNVDGTTYNLSGTNLNSLADSINSSGAGVTATVINIGGTGAADYRLSILGNKYSPTTLQLTDSTSSNLLDTLSTGSYVTYQVNGQPSTPINSDSRTLNFATGLTVSVYKAGSTDVNVTSSSASLAASLSAFASAYNSALDELSKSRGQNNGPLSGESIIYAVSQSLRTLTSSGTPSGSVQSIADLGLTYDKDGHLSVDSGVLATAMSNSASDVANFLGSSTSGFLQGAESVVNGIDDSTTGLISQTTGSLTKQSTALADKISGLQDRITLLQTSLTAKMTKADTLISSLQSQNSYFTSLFAQMRANQLSGF